MLKNKSDDDLRLQSLLSIAKASATRTTNNTQTRNASRDVESARLQDDRRIANHQVAQQAAAKAIDHADQHHARRAAASAARESCIPITAKAGHADRIDHVDGSIDQRHAGDPLTKEADRWQWRSMDQR